MRDGSRRIDGVVGCVGNSLGNRRGGSECFWLVNGGFVLCGGFLTSEPIS